MPASRASKAPASPVLSRAARAVSPTGGAHENASGVLAGHLLLVAFGLATCAAIPSRWAISGMQANGIFIRGLYFGGGLLSDLTTTAPVITLTLLSLSRHRRWLNVALLGFVLALCLLAQNGAAAFRFERGVLPGPIDLREGLGHRDFLTAHIPSVVFGSQFFLPNVVCSFAIALLLRHLYRSTPIVFIAWRSLAAGLGLWIVLMLSARQANAYASSLHNKDAFSASSAALMNGLLMDGAPFDGSPTSTRKLLGEFQGTEEEAIAGARELGFPDATLRRPLVTKQEGTPPAAKTPKPIIFHVSLESMRADDIHSLNPHAPKELTPFLNEIYDNPRRFAAFRHAHQSGVRTSQALGAMMCGIGALPFNLSATRDLGVLPLRCLPDVLVDAGFQARAFYGHEFVFDDMSTFLRAHHVTMFGRDSFTTNAPRGVWGAVSDAAVYDSALKAAEGDDGAQYNFILTLSHHAPYTAPADFAPAHRTEIESLCRVRSLHGDNCARLKTMRYADEALRRFVKRVSESNIADRAIVVVSGDHTVHQWAPWNGEPEPARAITQIPLFIWWSSPNAEVPDDLARRAALQAVSNADLPLMILSLMDRQSFASLREDQRWHTIGGGAPVVRGIDAHGNLFYVDPLTKEVHLPGITIGTLRGRDDVLYAALHDRPGLALLSRLVR